LKGVVGLKALIAGRVSGGVLRMDAGL